MSATILLISTLLQFAAAVLALRLVSITGRWRAWSLIAIALMLMGIRRSITFYRVVVGDVSLPPDLTAELVALTISVLMVSGVLLIGPLFKKIQRTQDELRESESRFRDVAEVAGDWIWEMDSDLRFTFLSPRFFELVPVAPNDIIGKTREEFTGVGREDKNWRQHFDDLNNRKPFHDFEYTVTAPDDQTRNLKISGKPNFDADNQFLGYRGTGTDITERKKVEALNLRLGRIIEKSLNEIYVFDAETLRFTDINSGARQNLGYSMDELKKLTPLDIKPRHTRQSFETLVRPLVDGVEEQIVFKTVHERKNGTTYEVEVHLQYLPRENPAVFVAILQDITERMQAEEDRRLALVDAEQANQAKSEFLATMSHELRTPLNAILGFSDILSHQYFGPPGEGKYREYAADIHASGEHLLELVNDLLDISTIEAGKQSLNKEMLMVNEMVAESFNAMDQKAREKGIKLETEVSKNLPLLYADKRATRQILLNLLSNAVKFTDVGGKITVSATASKENITFKISDTGQGISTEKLPNLTEPFNRGEQDPHKTVEGWGLGLSITKSLVDLHDGKLEIQSKIGKGTTVTVTFSNGAP